MPAVPLLAAGPWTLSLTFSNLYNGPDIQHLLQLWCSFELMLVKLSGKSGILQMFDVRGITTITVIIPFSHYGQGAGWVDHTQHSWSPFVLRLPQVHSRVWGWRTGVSGPIDLIPVSLKSRRQEDQGVLGTASQSCRGPPGTHPTPGVSGPRPPRETPWRGPLWEAVASPGRPLG